MLGEAFGIGIFTSVWGLGVLFMTSSKGRVEGKGKTNWRALGWGLVLGHVIPTVLMLRLKPDGQGILASQQIWTIARLFHPVFLFGFWTVLKTILPTSTTTAGTNLSTKKNFYVFSILASGFFHITSLTYILAPEMFPGWLDPAVSKALDPSVVLIPTPFWSEAVVSKVDFETGVAVFLQWDYLCSAAAIVVWAAAMYVEAAGKVKGGKGVLEVVVQTVAVGTLAGPAAAAAFLMLERDGVVAESVVVGGEKKRL